MLASSRNPFSGLLLKSLDRYHSLASDLGTPFYVLDPNRIVRAMDTLRDGLTQHYQNSEVTYSVKTNYLAAILRKVLAAGYRLEVVSRHELELARRHGATAQQILFNGPLKSAADLREAQAAGVPMNLDSIEELQALDDGAAVGLRVAATLQSGAKSRFGIDFDDAEAVAAVRRVVAQKSIQVVGLHLHHSSRRDAASYCARLDRLGEVAGLLGIEPAYVDIGGGIASVPPPEVAARLAYPIDDPHSLAQTIGRHALAKWGAGGPRVIIEPGIAVLAEAMNYVTRVISVKRRGSETIAVCDGSMFDVNPLRSSIPPPCHLLPPDRPAGSQPVTLYGGTCMEIDRLGQLAAEPRVGELAVIANVGAYSSCLAPEFIVPPAPVFDLDAGQTIRQRPAFGHLQGAGA